MVLFALLGNRIFFCLTVEDSLGCTRDMSPCFSCSATVFEVVAKRIPAHQQPKPWRLSVLDLGGWRLSGCPFTSSGGFPALWPSGLGAWIAPPTICWITQRRSILVSLKSFWPVRGGLLLLKAFRELQAASLRRPHFLGVSWCASLSLKILFPEACNFVRGTFKKKRVRVYEGSAIFFCLVSPLVPLLVKKKKG